LTGLAPMRQTRAKLYFNGIRRHSDRTPALLRRDRCATQRNVAGWRTTIITL
jgi:hypothetical protein